MGLHIQKDAKASSDVLLLTLHGDITTDDAKRLSTIIEETLDRGAPFGIFTHAANAKRFASPDVRTIFLQHAARVRAVERQRPQRTLLGHAVWLGEEGLPIFNLLQMQMGTHLLQGFVRQEDAIAFLQNRMAPKGLKFGAAVQQTGPKDPWDAPPTQPIRMDDESHPSGLER